MPNIQRPTKYTKDQIKGLVEGSNALTWESQVNQDVMIDFLDKLPAGSINLNTQGKIESLGSGQKPITEFINSVKRVLTSEKVTDFSVKPNDDVMKKAMTNFVNVDLSKYSSNGEHVIIGSDFSNNLVKYMDDNKDSLGFHANFQPFLHTAVMATFVYELPESVNTTEKRDALMDKFVPFTAGALAKLSKTFGNKADAKTLKYNQVLLGDEAQKSIVLNTISNSIKEVQNPKYQEVQDHATLQLLGKEYMKSPKKSMLQKIGDLFKGENSKRAEIYEEYKNTRSTTTGRGR